MIIDSLSNVPDLVLSIDPDPNGCPFSRPRLTIDASLTSRTGQTAESLAEEMAKASPSIVVRAHHADEGYINIDAIEMTDDEIEIVCKRISELLGSIQ